MIQEILSYDIETDTYYTKSRMTKKTEEFIRSHIASSNERMKFDYFMAEEWGIDEEFEDDALDLATGNFSDSQLPTAVIKEAEKLAEDGIGVITKEIVAQAQQNVRDTYKEKVDVIDKVIQEQRQAEEEAKAKMQAELEADMMDDMFEGIDQVQNRTVGLELADEFTIGLFDM